MAFEVSAVAACGAGFVEVVSSGGSPDPTSLERATEAQVYGEDAYVDLFARGPRLTSPESMENFLQTPVASLEAAGCEVDTHMGGAYGPAILGEDDGGDLAGLTLTRASKSWSGTFSSGLMFTGGYNNQVQFAGFRDDGGFLVGRFVRSIGTKGTFYGVAGTCPAPMDYEAAIGSWYRGPLPPQ